jgi:hypothetical protein
VDDKSDVRQRICTALEGKQYEIKNPMSLVYLIIDKCSGVLFPLVREVDEDLQFLEFFADSIGHMVCKQTTAFNHLWAHSCRMGELQKRRDLLLKLRSKIVYLTERWKRPG